MFIGGWRAVVFRCDHAPATRSKNIHPHMCYKRHFVAIIEFDFFVEQHLLCTQLKMGLLMSRGEDWRKGCMFAAPESMPLSALDCIAESGWGTFSKFRVLLTVGENSIYLFSAMCVAEFIRIFQWPLIRAFHSACLRFWYWCVILMSDKRLPKLYVLQQWVAMKSTSLICKMKGSSTVHRYCTEYQRRLAIFCIFH